MSHLDPGIRSHKLAIDEVNVAEVVVAVVVAVDVVVEVVVPCTVAALLTHGPTVGAEDHFTLRPVVDAVKVAHAYGDITLT